MEEKTLTRRQLMDRTGAPSYVIDYLRVNGRLPLIRKPKGSGDYALYAQKCVRIVLDHLDRGTTKRNSSAVATTLGDVEPAERWQTAQEIAAQFTDVTEEKLTTWLHDGRIQFYAGKYRVDMLPRLLEEDERREELAYYH